MKLLSLDLLAYGPFAGTQLDLSAGTEGLHLIHGPNEAGKSSALRALVALLYGIPARTTDNFRHGYRDLRIGGRFRGADGRELYAVRRKGNRETLFADADGTVPLDEAQLGRLLGGVPQEVFQQAFGLDHATLVKGGDDLREGKGDLGEALFGSALGATGLHEVLAALQIEAEGLYKARGQNQPIPAALRQLNHLRKFQKEAMLGGSEFSDKTRAFEDLNTTIEDLEEALLGLRLEKAGLERLRRAFTALGEREDVVREMAAIEGIPENLPDSFVEEVTSSDTDRRDAQGKIAAAAPKEKALELELAGIEVPEGLLAQEPTISDYYQELGRHRKASQDLGPLKVEFAAERERAEERLREVRPDVRLAEAETLRPALQLAKRLRQLANRHAALTAEREGAQRELGDAERNLAAARSKLETTPEGRDLGGLKMALEVALRDGGTLDVQVGEKEAECARLEGEGLAALSRLGFGLEPPLAQIEILPFPLQTTVDAFTEEWSKLEIRQSRTAERREEAEADRKRALRDLDEITRAGEVPTEGDLEHARERRGAVWALVRERLAGVDVTAQVEKLIGPDEGLEGGYETLVTVADDLADRLRREAQRVERLAGVLADQTDAERRLEHEQNQARVHQSERDSLEIRWKQVWVPCGITEPLSPGEMNAWLLKVSELVRQVSELAEAQRRRESSRCRRGELRSALAREINECAGRVPDTGEQLDPVVKVAQTLLETIEGINTQRKILSEDVRREQKRVTEAGDRLKDVTGDVDAWKTEWCEVMVGLGVPSDMPPEDASDVLDGFVETFKHLDAAAKLQHRIDRINEDLKEFGDRVRGLAERIAPEIADRPAPEVVAELNARLKVARDDRTQKSALEERLAEVAKELEEEQARAQACATRTTELCALAGTQDNEQLRALVARMERKSEFEDRLQGLEKHIRELGDGVALTQLIAEATSTDPDSLPGRIEALRTRIEATESELKERLTRRGNLQRELDQMDGSDAAAKAADQAQGVVAKLRADVEHYMAVKLAHTLLRTQIDRFRADNEGPILKRAGELFARLSLGRFAAVHPDYSEEPPVLVGVRKGGGTVPVEGMSSGTRDQLYLALRLASLERHAGSAVEPLPFVVDDVLVNFDEDRSRATLECLNEIAKVTQVILFTHHYHIVELAKPLAGTFVHTLAA